MIPVLDVQAGRAVRAVAGDRARYRPVRSILGDGPDPLGLARAIRLTLGLDQIYLADLDAIAGSPPAGALYAAIVALGIRLWVDAGVFDRDSLPPLLDSGVATVVVGLETVRGPGALAGVVEAAGADRVLFSLDLRDGRPLVETADAWGTDEPLAIADRAIEAGCSRLLLLDLARVGTGQGPGELDLLDALAHRPGLELGLAGGVRGPADLHACADAGASFVLVGSALHDGTLVPADWGGAG